MRGLDGRKVGVVLDDGKTLNSDHAILAERGEVPADLEELKGWWDETGQPNSADDKSRVEAARIFGGQMALTLTAAVPATMFVGYLLLVLYFKSRGGYSALEIGESEGDGTAESFVDEQSDPPADNQQTDSRGDSDN